MNRAIENDTAAILTYLRAQVSPTTVACLDIQRYQSAWLRYGYGAMDAARALEWYRQHRPESRDIRPKVIDMALGWAAMDAVAQRCQFGVQTETPCSSCQYLRPGNPKRGHHCDRLLIWVAEPTTSTCPEHKGAAE